MCCPCPGNAPLSHDAPPRGGGGGGGGGNRAAMPGGPAAEAVPDASAGSPPGSPSSASREPLQAVDETAAAPDPEPAGTAGTAGTTVPSATSPARLEAGKATSCVVGGLTGLSRYLLWLTAKNGAGQVSLSIEAWTA